MVRKRKQYTGEEKLAIRRKHLVEGVAVYNTQRLRSAISHITPRISRRDARG